MNATLVGGPCDGREMDVESRTLHVPTTSSSVLDWLTDWPPTTAKPPVLLIAVYRRRDGFLDGDGQGRFDFAGFAHQLEDE